MASSEMRKRGEGATSAGCSLAADGEEGGGGCSVSSSSSSVTNRDLFLEKVRESNEAIQRSDFVSAVGLYTDAIELDPVNHILYSNRSAAYIKLERYDDALKDALKAKQLDATWTKAYYREGIALQLLDRHTESLVAFASGLTLDPRNGQLLSGIVDTALRSPLKGRFQPTYQQLQSMKLDRSPFVIVSVIGQDLLACGHHSASVAVLEAALRVGTCSLKLRGSVFSALSSAHWLLKSADQAIAYMQQDLSVAKSLGDQPGECRVHGNLGSAHFARGDYRESLTHHRCQLRLAMRLKLRDAAASALSSLGHVYSAVGDYPNALASHKQCVLLVKQSGDRALEAREIGSVGAVYAAMGDADNALVCHEEHLRMARAAGDRPEEARALSNLGSAHHCRRDYSRAAELHGEVLRVARAIGDGALEARAHAGLGHAARAAGDVGAARRHHEQQLNCALRARDKAAEARAIANLGVVFQQLGEHEAALKLHARHLSLATRLGDRAAQGRAYGNMGIAHSALGRHEAAIKFHKQELAISKEVHDRHSEASTHGNLAVAYQALGVWEQALQHYSAHLSIARDLKDIGGEARALSNIGHYYSVRGEFAQAVPFYQQQLQLSQELQDARGEASACHCLGFAHHALGAHREAVLYYDQYLALARELGDRWHEARAQCNLGLAHVALGQYARALDCQYGYLQAAHELRSVPNKFRAMGNVGDILVKMGSLQEALILYGQQLKLAKQIEDRSFEAAACGSLGVAHRTLGQYDMALSHHEQELDIRRDLADVGGQCRAHGSFGDTYMAAGDYESAFASYERQLEQARAARDVAAEARACGNMAIARLNGGRHEEAIGHLEQELATLEQIGAGGAGSSARVAQPLPAAAVRLLLEKGRAYGNLGDCYLVLRDAEEAVRCHEQHLVAAQGAGSLADQDRAYRGLADAHRAVGHLQQALVCCEKRLVVAHEMDSGTSKAAAYGELGSLHSLLGNFDQAIGCLEHQITLAKEQGDRMAEASACCGLGAVYQQMGECHRAVDYHRRDLALALTAGDAAGQCRAYGNLGLAFESLGELAEALSHQEQHLSLAAQTGDLVAKTLAYSSLGRVHHALGRHADAVQYLRQGLQIAADVLGRREDEAKIRHRLGLALWAHGSLDEAHSQLCRAAELFESIRRDSQAASDYRLSLFDLQTASYQALQRVLVALGRHEEALLMAERGRTRAFIDLLLERQAGAVGGFDTSDGVPVTMEQIRSAVDRAKASVIYYSIAAGQLYSWLIVPDKGMVKFHECSMSESPELCSSGAEDSQSLNASVLSALDQCLGQARESLGVDSHLPSSESSSRSAVHKKHSSSSNSSSVAAATVGGAVPASDAESEADEMWQQRPDDAGERLGFLRMASRDHPLGGSSYSLGSLFSLSSSLAGGAGSGARHAGTRGSGTTTAAASWSGRAPLSALYALLIAPMEEHLPRRTGGGGSSTAAPLPSLIVVLQGDLYLVPFALLKSAAGGGGSSSSGVGSASGGEVDDRYLFERFAVTVAPSLSSLSARGGGGGALSDGSRLGLASALVVGNPSLPAAVREPWHLSDLPSAEHEARLVADMLGVRPCLGAAATKESVLRSLPHAEVVHVAAHVSWKLSSIVLSPSEAMRSAAAAAHFDGHTLDDSGGSSEASVDAVDLDSPSLGEYLLTAADILNVKLLARLVVLSSGHTDDRAARINSDGVIGLTRALLAAGVQCVLFSLWPVPADASKAFMKMFYLALLQGRPASQALSEAMKKVQSAKQFCHPSNWAGWVLVGADVKLSSKTALMGQALCDILQSTSTCREAFRVLLHLVEKSLQRIQSGEEKGMYTTVESIESKIGANVRGWKDLLAAVGFTFETSGGSAGAGEEGGGVVVPAVFFPLSDPGDRLSQCSISLQALLALPRGSLAPLARLLRNHEAGEAIIVMLKDMLSRNDASNQMRLRVKLWRVDGCHELLASLGFDLLDVGKDEVTVKMGKTANKRLLQLAAQALAILFSSQGSGGGSGGRGRGIAHMSSSSSMESLNSSHSGSNTTTTSNLSKDSSTPHDSSTPPMSPLQAKYTARFAADAVAVVADTSRDKGFDFSGNISGYGGSIKMLRSKAMPFGSTKTGRSPRHVTSPGDERVRHSRRPGADSGTRQTAIVESDDTPTDETGSVSSVELSASTSQALFTGRLPPQGRDAENQSTPSSHSENEESYSPSSKPWSHSAVTDSLSVARQRLERPKGQAAARSQGMPNGQRPPQPAMMAARRSVAPEPAPRAPRSGSPASSSSNSSNTSSRTVTAPPPSATAAVAKDVAELARKVMADTQAEWLAVQELQRTSLLASRRGGATPTPARRPALVATDNDEGVSVDEPSSAASAGGSEPTVADASDLPRGHCRTDTELSLHPAKPLVAPKPRMRTAGAHLQQHPAVAGSAVPPSLAAAEEEERQRLAAVRPRASGALQQQQAHPRPPIAAAAAAVSSTADLWPVGTPTRLPAVLTAAAATTANRPDPALRTCCSDDPRGNGSVGGSSDGTSSKSFDAAAPSSAATPATDRYEGTQNSGFCSDDEPVDRSVAAAAVDSILGGGARPALGSRALLPLASAPARDNGAAAPGSRGSAAAVRSWRPAADSVADRLMDGARQSVFDNVSFIHDDVVVGETIIIGAVDRTRKSRAGLESDGKSLHNDDNLTDAATAASATKHGPLPGKMQPGRPGPTGPANGGLNGVTSLPAMFYVAAGLRSSEC